MLGLGQGQSEWRYMLWSRLGFWSLFGLEAGELGRRSIESSGLPLLARNKALSTGIYTRNRVPGIKQNAALGTENPEPSSPDHIRITKRVRSTGALTPLHRHGQSDRNRVQSHVDPRAPW